MMLDLCLIVYINAPQNKLNKTACLKNALFVTGIFQYHVTHDVSVYAMAITLYLS